MSCVQQMVLALLPVVLLASAALGKALQAIIHGVMYELTGRKAGEYTRDIPGKDTCIRGFSYKTGSV